MSGSKRVTLFEHDQSPRLYPHGADPLRRNTSRVDIEARASSSLSFSHPPVGGERGKRGREGEEKERKRAIPRLCAGRRL